MTVKAVFFDMGGTIETFWYSPDMRLQATHGLQQLLVFQGINIHLSDEKLYELVTDGLTRYHQWRLVSLNELPANQVWRDYILADYPQEFAQLETIADDLMVWLETHYYERKMRPEIPGVLQAIQNMGLKIGLISNVNSKGQVPLNLRQYGIIHYFNPIVLSSEYTRRKPDPAIFHHAARLSNTPTSECIYIGDRIARDILGAKRAGFKLAIQIKHSFKHGETDEGAIPDLVLDDMTELLPVLESEREKEKSTLPQGSSDRIRAVLFDADGVLYFRKDKEQEYRRILTELGITAVEVPDKDKEVFRRKASIGLITFAQYKQEVLKLYGVTDPCQMARGVQIAQDESDRVHFFRHARETLNKLRSRNLYLGIVTDTAHPLHEKISKLERGRIGDLWDTIISSREVGVQKPDPRIYHLALRQLGIKPGEAIFVGHKAIELDGARDAGIKTIAFNYEPGARADFYLQEFSDLLELPVLNGSLSITSDQHQGNR